MRHLNESEFVFEKVYKISMDLFMYILLGIFILYSIYFAFYKNIKIIIVKDHLLEATVIHNPYIGNLLQKRSWQKDKVYRYDV